MNKKTRLPGLTSNDCETIKPSGRGEKASIRLPDAVPLFLCLAIL
jgi:hypothetical protein